MPSSGDGVPPPADHSYRVCVLCGRCSGEWAGALDDCFPNATNFYYHLVLQPGPCRLHCLTVPAYHHTECSNWPVAPQRCGLRALHDLLGPQLLYQHLPLGPHLSGLLRLCPLSYLVLKPLHCTASKLAGWLLSLALHT